MVHTEDNRFVDDNDGDSGSSSSGSQDSGSTDTNDNSTVVTVVGDPGSKEGLTTVGRGDTIEESERDAATNEDFDADEGTDIDDFEESFGTDQPDINPDDSASDSTSVVVTENQQGEQVTVGQGQTLQGARNQAAANPNFDAAEGDPVDAFEEAQGFGQGDGTSTDIFRDRRQQRRVQERQEEQNVFEENIEDAQAIQAQLTDNQREFAQARNPNTPIIENVGDVVRTVGREGQDVIEGNNPRQSFRDIEDSFLIEGQGIISQGQQLGKDVRKDFKKRDIEVRSVGQPVENLGSVLDFAGADTVGNQLQDTGEKIDRSLVGGVATGGTAAGGLALQAPGAAPKVLRGTLQEASRQDVESILKIGSGRLAQGSAEIALSSRTPESQQNNAFEQFDGKDEPNIVEAGAGGTRLAADQAKDDPVKFIFSEAGEEAIETVGGFALGGFAGAAAAAAPTPTPEVSVTSTVKNKASSAKQAVTNPNAAGSLAGAFVPDETTPASDPRPGNDPRPGTTETVVLQDTTGFDLQTETPTQAQETETTGTDFDSNIEFDGSSEVVVESGSQEAPDTISQPENIAESQPQSDVISVPEAVSEGRPEARPETGSPSITGSTPITSSISTTETKIDTKPPEILIEGKPDPQPNPTPEDGGSEDDDDNGFSLFTQETKDTQFRASVGAEILGITAEDKPGRSQASDPTNLRPILED
jgi:hypothetical protein